jgi:hypothetical protein
MAIVDKGLKIELPESIIPDGASVPAFDAVIDPEYKRNYTLEVLKATVQNAAKEVTFDNIVDDVAVGILKQINDIVTADFIGTNTVEYHTVWKRISSNSQRSKENDFYTDTAFSYIIEVEVLLKTT